MESSRKSHKKKFFALCAVLLLGLALRFTVVAVFSDVKLYGGDQKAYMRDAHLLLKGERMWANRGPGYPVFLAAVQRVIGEGAGPSRMGNVALGGLLILGVWAIGQHLFSPRTGLLAALWIAFYPRSVFFPIYLYSGNLYILCVVGGLYFSCLALSHKNPAACFGAGLCLGFGSLTREMLFYFIPVTGIVVLAMSEGSFKRRMLKAILIVVVAFLTIAPWTIRNWMVHKRFMLVGYSDGSPLYEGSIQPEINTHEERMKIRRAKGYYYFKQSGDSRIEANARLREEARRLIRKRQPYWIFQKIVSMGPGLIRPNSVRDTIQRSPFTTDQLKQNYMLLKYIFLPVHLFTLLLACVGFTHWRLRSPQLLLLLYLAFSFMVHIVTISWPFRYQYPYEWIIVMAGAVALDRGLPRKTKGWLVASFLLMSIAISQAPLKDLWLGPLKQERQTAIFEDSR